MKLKKKNIMIIIIIIVGVIVIGGLIRTFNKDNGEKSNNEILEEENKKVTIIDENSKSRPIAFTIDNSEDARVLQAGLQRAYIVYEMINYADGRTRFLALFKDSDAPLIGPVRSVRHYHLDYILENDAILAHFGQSTIAYDNLKKLNINNINGIYYGSNNTKDNLEDGRYFWTEASNKVDISHRRFTSMELIKEGINKFQYEEDTNQSNILKYSGKTINLKDMSNSEVASNVEIYYANNNYVTYEYDSKNEVYLRNVSGSKHIDHETNEQITVKNIITYQVRNYTIPGNVDILQELENVGKGEGYYITNGYAVKINWEKECHECQTKYTYLNGDELILNDGNTFIEIQPLDKELNIS